MVLKVYNSRNRVAYALNVKARHENVPQKKEDQRKVFCLATTKGKLITNRLKIRGSSLKGKTICPRYCPVKNTNQVQKGKYLAWVNLN